MFNPSTQSHSKTPLPPKSNGVEEETESNPTTPKYFVEDFSQQAINRGQVEINFLLTVVNEKTRIALEQLEAAVEKLANHEKVDLKALKHAISAVHKANQKVAGPFPPGCNPAVVDRPTTE
jgi:hypothetical protein